MSCYNLVVDLLQEAPYFFAAQVKADFGYGLNREEGENRATWGNPLQNSGCSIQLVELIPHRPKKLNIKKISVEEPLAKLRSFSSVAPLSLDFLRRTRVD